MKAQKFYSNGVLEDEVSAERTNDEAVTTFNEYATGTADDGSQLADISDAESILEEWGIDDGSERVQWFNQRNHSYEDLVHLAQAEFFTQQCDGRGIENGEVRGECKNIIWKGDVHEQGTWDGHGWIHIEGTLNSNHIELNLCDTCGYNLIKMLGV